MSRSRAATVKRGWEVGCRPRARVDHVFPRRPDAFRRLVPLTPALPDLPKLAREVPQDKIHQLLGALEEARHILLARLQPQPAPSSQPKPKPDRLLLSADETAKMLGLPRRTVYELAKRKDRVEYLPAVRFGSAIRFKLTDVESWMERLRA